MGALHLGYALVGALSVLLAFGSSRIRYLPVSEPLLALLLGVLAGPRVLGLIDLPDAERPGLTLEAARLLLAVSLMAVALRYPTRDLRPLLRPVTMLLVLAMPAMAAVTWGLGVLILGLPIALAALLGACLTPTDPVLAASVVTGKPAEQDLPARTRQLLSLESGGNDGLAFPLVVVTLAFVMHEELATTAGEAAYAVLAAAVIGIAAGVLAGKAIDAASRREDIDAGSLLVFTLVLAVAVLGLARIAHTDGVLAVFVAGLAYNVTIARGERGPQQNLDEGINRYLLLPLFLILGVELPWAEWGQLGWSVVGFPAAVLLLRRLPVLLLLRRPVRLAMRDAVFLGWFGPIGVSALFYLTHAEEQGAQDERLWAAGSLVVVASTVVHGISSAPGRRAYGRAAHRPDASVRSAPA